MNNIAKPLHRSVAGLIDLSILYLPLLYAVYSLSKVNNINSLLDGLWYFVVLFMFISVLFPVIDSFMISVFGGTFGKLLTGTKIVNSDNNNLSFWKAFLRNHIAYTVSYMLFCLGFIWIFVDKERRGWHDMIADTYVVTSNKFLILIGSVALIVLIGINGFMIKNIINNFENNKDMYSELLNVSSLYEEIAKSEETVVNESNPDLMATFAFIAFQGRAHILIICRLS